MIFIQNMVTIAHLAEKLVSDKPFLQEALFRKIINYQSLAEELQPEIEKELKKKVKATTIMISLRRYADKLEERYLKKIVFGPECDLDMKSKIIELSVKKSNSLFSLVPKMFSLIDFEKGGILNFTNGNFDVSIVTNEKYKDEILELLKKETIIETNVNLVALSFRYSKEFRQIPGVLHQTIRVLAWENVNIIELIETMTETIFILNEDDSLRAFKVLQNLIKQ
jgi:hypothetical protein